MLGRLALTPTDVCELRHNRIATTAHGSEQGVLQTKRREAQVRLERHVHFFPSFPERAEGDI
ncbi:TraY domain-containing protein [Lentzea pudingi]|uniref:TraY domain-containing protein n=1 Tax=Lentzea pudingi TaxID=1789439 RepID=UPI00357144E1